VSGHAPTLLHMTAMTFAVQRQQTESSDVRQTDAGRRGGRLSLRHGGGGGSAMPSAGECVRRGVKGARFCRQFTRTTIDV